MRSSRIQNDIFQIGGGSFRLLVGDLHDLYCRYFSLARRLTEAKTEKDFLRIQKGVSGYERGMRRFCRRWGLPADGTSWAYDTMEEAIREKWLSPVSKGEAHD